MGADPAADELARLSDQKADDWRSISEVTPTLFGVAGAIFGAGIASSNAVVLAIAPMPLFLGIFHMVRNAKLQLQLIAFLAVRGDQGFAWEEESPEVRDAVYRVMAGDSSWGRVTWWLRQPSGWNTWLIIAVVTAALVNATGAIAGYDHWHLGLPIGLVLTAAATLLLLREKAQIERDRRVWTQAWEAKGAGEDIEKAARAALRPTT